MPLLETLLERGGSWPALFAALSVPGLVATVCWAPFLAADRVRSLFRGLPPTRSLLPSYLLAGLAASLPFVVGTLGVLASVDPNSPESAARLSGRLFTLSLLLSVGYTLGLPLVSIVVVRAVGIDWDPTGYGASTWLLLAAGGAWYAALFAVPLTIASLVLAFPGGY